MTDKEYFELGFASNSAKVLYEATYAFNDISGAIRETSDESFVSQLNFIEEEFNELKYSLSNTDNIETLDGLVDCAVTLMGYMQKFHFTTGADIGTAMQLVATNNLEKYPKTKQLAEDTVKMYADKGVDTYYTYNDTYQVYVIRDKITGKVKKPMGFKSVDLSSCFPKLN